METVNKYPDLGGNIELYLIPSNLVNPITDLTIYYSGADPTCQIKCANESIKHIFKTTENPAGKVYEHTVTAFVPGRNGSNEDILHRLKQYRHIVIICDSTGQYWRIGDDTIGLILDVDFDSSDDPSGKNGYDITLAGKLLSPAKKINFPPVYV
jgi:hypothetical protein